MVTFHRIPYSVALARGLQQDKILDQLCEGTQRLDDLDWQKAAQLVAALTPLEQLQ
jgi:kynurenine 3-monooxygenase